MAKSNLVPIFYSIWFWSFSHLKFFPLVVDSLLDGLSDELESETGSIDDCFDKNDQDTTMTAPKRKRQRITLKQEIEYLKDKEVELEERLRNLTSRMASASAESIWATRAMELNIAAQRSMQENAVLRKIAEEQLKTIHTLERVFRKRPKWAVRYIFFYWFQCF